MISETDIRRAKDGNPILDTVQDLAHSRFRRANGTWWKGPCPNCGGDDRYRINTASGQGLCRHECGCDGDVIAIVQTIYGLDFLEAIERLIGSVEHVDDAPRPKPAERPTPPRPSRATQNPFTLQTNDRIIAEMEPILGGRYPDAARYLTERRGIDLEILRDVLTPKEALGYHPEVLFKEDDPDNPLHVFHGRWFGAIIGVLIDPLTGERTGAITRTYLLGGDKLRGPDGRKVAAKSLGRGGGVIPLSRDEDVLEGLHTGEGIETCLAGMADGYRPMWACGSTSELRRLPVIPGIESLTVLVDNDPSSGGDAAFEAAAARWHEAGREVWRIRSDELGDYNDVVMRGRS